VSSDNVLMLSSGATHDIILRHAAPLSLTFSPTIHTPSFFCGASAAGVMEFLCATGLARAASLTWAEY